MIKWATDYMLDAWNPRTKELVVQVRVELCLENVEEQLKNDRWYAGKDGNELVHVGKGGFTDRAVQARNKLSVVLAGVKGG